MSRRRPKAPTQLEGQLDMSDLDGWGTLPATGPALSALDMLNAWRGVMRFLGLSDDAGRRGGVA